MGDNDVLDYMKIKGSSSSSPTNHRANVLENGQLHSQLLHDTDSLTLRQHHTQPVALYPRDTQTKNSNGKLYQNSNVHTDTSLLSPHAARHSKDITDKNNSSPETIDSSHTHDLHLLESSVTKPPQNHKPYSSNAALGIWMIVDGIGLALIAGATVLEGYELWVHFFKMHRMKNYHAIILWFAGRSLQVLGLLFLIGKY